MQHFNLLQLFVLFFTACSFNLSRQLFSEEPSIPSDKQTKLVKIMKYLAVKGELTEMDIKNMTHEYI